VGPLDSCLHSSKKGTRGEGKGGAKGEENTGEGGGGTKFRGRGFAGTRVVALGATWDDR